MGAPLLPARAELAALIGALGPAERSRLGAALELPPAAVGRAAGSRGAELLLAAVLSPEVQAAAVLRELRRCCPAALRRIDQIASRCLPLSERIGRVAPSLPPLRRFTGREPALAAAHAALDQGQTTWICGPPGSGRLSLLARIGRDRVGAHSLVWTVRGPDPARIDLDLAQLAGALGLRPDPEEARGWLSENSDWLIILIDSDPDAAGVQGPGACLCSAEGAPPTLLERPPAPEAGEPDEVPAEPADPAAEPPAAPARRGAALTLAWSAASAADAPGDELPWSAAEARGALWRAARPEPRGPRPAPRPRAVVQLGDGEGLAQQLTRVTGRAGPLRAQLDALRATLEPEEDALLRVLGALGPAPVPLGLLLAPRLDGAPAWMGPLLRSRFTAEGAARRLVSAEVARRDGGGLWLSEAVRSAMQAAPPEPGLDPTLCALLGEALAAATEDPRALLPHVHALVGRVAAPLRCRLLARVGRALAEADAPRARLYLRRALSGGGLLGPDRATAQNDLGVLTRRAGDPAGARALLRAALAGDAADGAADPEATASLHYHIALCCIDLGERQPALHALDAALALVEAPRAALLRGLCALRRGQLAHAEGSADEARAWLEQARRDLQRANAAPDRALELELTAAAIEEEAGDRDRALHHAERAWGLARAGKDAQLHAQARALLERLDA
jgi:tetratricopeptide (TPR) repeat protein